ncbi:hypothetical protein O3P69_005623 [Scylla paramamosain]|uniref:Transmembrane and coiled-coil domain-containing protein 4 n=1 Tax=Scylla paramamosain TaxID=85552 RepID=A0AAW0U6E3_SCYPA
MATLQEQESRRRLLAKSSVIQEDSLTAGCATSPASPDVSSSDFDFALSTMNRLARHLGLPEQVRQVMEMTLRGQVEGSSLRSYVQVLKEEPPLARSRMPVVQDLVMFAVQGGCYDARIRVLITYVTCLLHVSIDLLEMYEESVLEYLTVEEEVPMTEEEEREEARRRKYKKIKRYTAIGLATLGGGAVLGLTGGLAAPFIGAGLGTIIGAGGAAAISSTAGVAVVGSMFGAAGAGLTGFKMQKRIGDVEEFAFDYLTDGSHLHITIAISGWLTKEGTEEFSKPWLRLYHSREQYCLRYESQYLLELGKAMDYLLQFALSMAVQETLKYTILAGIISAITWPTSLLTLASVIDNPWGVCCRRSAQVGKQLAEVLLQGQHGRRPVTLIGFSLGARVIYYCLQELHRKKSSASIVQDAIMLGCPGEVVSGRIINGYCQGDWLLRFLYRSSSGSIKIAGLMPVEWQDRRMFNFDLSEIVTGHMDYAKKMDVILHLLGIRTRDPFNLDDPRVKKSASDYPGFSPYYGKEDISGIRPSSSDSMLFCGHNAPLARSRSSDDLLISRSSTLLDPSGSPLPEENTKPRSLSSYDFASRKCVPLKVIGPQCSFSQDKQSRSLASSNVQIDQAGMSRSLGEVDFKEQVTSSKGYFDFFSRKSQPSTGTTFSKDKNTLAAQEKFKRRTVSSGNLFPTKPGTSGRKELSRTASQDQPRHSIFQIFSKKQERIDEA